MIDNPSEIAGVSKRQLKVYAAIAGVMAIIAVTISIYAFVSTPGVYRIPIYVEGRLQRTETKLFYLSLAPLVQVVLFAVTIFPLIQWKKFARKMQYPTRFASPYDIFGTNQLNTMALMQFGIISFCVFGAFNLWLTLSRAIEVLSQALVGT